MKKLLISFGLLLAAVVAADVARRFGRIDGLTEKRAIGLVLGSMAIVVGNYLPKMRLLGSPAAERISSWILVVAGAAYLALFVIVPLGLARQAAAIIGVAVFVMLAILWVTELRNFRMRQPAISLLLTFLYLLATAIVVYLFGGQHWTEWIHGTFFMLYLTLYAIGDQRCLRD